MQMKARTYDAWLIEGSLKNAKPTQDHGWANQINRRGPVNQEPNIYDFFLILSSQNLPDREVSWKEKRTCLFPSRYSWNLQLHLSSFLLPHPSSSLTNLPPPHNFEFPLLPSLFLPITTSSPTPAFQFQTTTSVFCNSLQRSKYSKSRTMQRRKPALEIKTKRGESSSSSICLGVSLHLISTISSPNVELWNLSK